MKRRKYVLLLAALVLLSAVAAREYRQRIRWQRAVNNSYRHAFSEVTASVEQMDTALQKGLYVTSAPMLCSLCDEIYAQSKAAQMALGQLPCSSETLEQTAAFAATLGDYACALSRSCAQSGQCPGDRQDWAALSQAAGQLYERLSALELALNEGEVSIDTVEQAQSRMAQGSADSFQQVEAEFPETPSLIYDGPFSQHLTDRVPEMTRGQPEVDQTQALTIARTATGWADLSPAGTVAGNLPCWVFASPDGVRTAQITRQGGFLLTALCLADVGQARLSEDEAIAAAVDILTALGYGDMAHTYTQRYGDTLTVHFCYAPEGLRVYPDLVKVTVSLADGTLTGFEAQGYLTCHHERNLPQPTVTAQQAREGLSPLLTLLGQRLAVIPSRGEYELLCWECMGENEAGQHVISYLNAETGAEERVLLLVEEEGGTLAV